MILINSPAITRLFNQSITQAIFTQCHMSYVFLFLEMSMAIWVGQGMEILNKLTAFKLLPEEQS